MVEIDPKYQGRINRMRNLPMFVDYTDEMIYEHLLRKEEEKKGKLTPKEASDTYTTRYNKLLDQLRSEYGIDMNESNDAEALKNLIRQTLQLEAIDRQIRELQDDEHGMNFDGSRTYKNLADVQRSIIMSMTDLQDRLGISRKLRKEKSVDNVPQFMEALKKKGKEFFDRKTEVIRCNKCEIELFRYWVNFPKMKNKINLDLQCWKCQESVLYGRE